MKTKNNPQIIKSFGPDSVQRNATRFEKDTVKHLPISPLQKSFGPDSVQRKTTRFEKDTVKHLPISPRIDKENEQRKNPVLKPDSLNKE
jgi:hypothetical protein